MRRGHAGGGMRKCVENAAESSTYDTGGDCLVGSG